MRTNNYLDNILTTQDFVERCLNREYYYPTAPSSKDKYNIPITAHYLPGETNLVLVLGENAGGKSFFKRVVKIVADALHKDFIEVSQEDRLNKAKNKAKLEANTSGSTYPYKYYNEYYYKRDVEYGDEQYYPTSLINIKSVMEAIDICKKRYFRHYLFLDSPETGLTDNYACSMGIYLSQFVSNIPKETATLFVSTNSKILVEELIDHKPHFLYLGGKENYPKSVEEWLDAPVVPEPFENLISETNDRYDKLLKIIKAQDTEKNTTKK